MGISTFDVFKHMNDIDGLVSLSDEDLRILQGILLQMLKDIDSVCDELGLDYNLAGGNCLGALRHKGFIPWDDDADINMTRESYERFVPVFLERFGDKYWVHDLYRKPNYELCSPRIRLKGTVLRCRDDFNEDECGVYVDVFIMENAPSNPVLRTMHEAVSLGLGLLYSCRRFAQHREYYRELAGDNKRLRRTFNAKIAAGTVLSVLPLQTWARAWDRWNSICRDNHSSHVVCPVGRKHYFGELWRRDVLYPAVRVPYEGVELCIPRQADKIMRSFYGDYMTVPDSQNRETHVVYELNLGEFADSKN